MTQLVDMGLPCRPLSQDGTFERRRSGWMINGAFFGPDHVEAAGTFRRSGIIGAFGAKKE